LLGPIFSGGQIEGNVRASEAVQRQALVTYIQDIQTAFREVDDALISIQKNREELAAQNRRVKALKDNARYANIRYKEGYVSYIEVLDADRSLFDTELQQTQNQAAVFNALIAIYKAMGGGWVMEAEKVANAIDYAEPPNTHGVFRPTPTQPSAVQAEPAP
jgi:multidrug efflux system outer membrane protein